jgi:hypothetical protein
LTVTDRLTASCVVKDSLKRDTRSSKASDDPDKFEAVESMRRLMALGLTAGEVEELGLDRPTLQAICEYARLDDEDDSRPPADAVDATLSILEGEMRNAELEQEMLGLRKRALKNRVRLLGKLAHLLAQRDGSIADR